MTFIIITLIRWLIMLIGLIGAAGMLPFFITALVYYFKSRKEIDNVKKEAYLKKVAFFVALPFILITVWFLLVLLCSFFGI